MSIESQMAEVRAVAGAAETDSTSALHTARRALEVAQNADHNSKELLRKIAARDTIIDDLHERVVAMEASNVEPES